MRPPQRVGVVGLGYAGLTLTAALLGRGHHVLGVDRDPRVLGSLRRSELPVVEPGVGNVLAARRGRGFELAEHVSDDLDAVVLCVSTPVDPVTRGPLLANLAAAAAEVAERCRPDTVVVVRSTVPVGACRDVVLPPLLRAWGGARLVMAPERTIQGQALRELVELPQVVGGLDERSLAAGTALFASVANRVVAVSSLEAAELVKLANNCHTDVSYAYGNEVALVAEQHGLDPLEVIRAANLDYPRPDLARPGFVGGGCLSKDPYLLVASARGRPPALVAAARRLNEELPVQVAATVVRLLQQDGVPGSGRVALLGWAYKGRPVTDDLRGAPVDAVLPVLHAAGLEVVGHDPLVDPAVLRRHGADAVVGVAEAFGSADAVVLLNDHPAYALLDLAPLLRSPRLRLVYDAWRVLDEAAVRAAGVRYASIGYLPAAPPRAARPLLAARTAG